MPNTLNLDEVRAKFTEGLGKARLETVVRYTTGPQTLTGTADQIWCAGTFTVNLPASPNDGDTYEFLQETNAATLTVGRNGKNIDGAAADTTVVGAASNVWKTLVWSATANTWRTR
jgi:hypothetical protein